MKRAVPTLIFDCDGVLADTERYGHLPAFNRTFDEFGLPVHWTEQDYAQKLRIGGGKERMSSLLTPEFVAAAHLPADVEAQQQAVASWHRRKTEIYTQMVQAGLLPGRPGVARVAAQANAAGWTLAVASTSAEASVRAVLTHVVGDSLAERFTVFAGDIVKRKKPSPDIYHLAVAELGAVRTDTLVIEDSRNGLDAAIGAGLRCLITVNDYTAGEDFTEAAMVVTCLGDPDGEHATILANRTAAQPTGVLTLEDLGACLGARPASFSTPTGRSAHGDG